MPENIVSTFGGTTRLTRWLLASTIIFKRFINKRRSSCTQTFHWSTEHSRWTIGMKPWRKHNVLILKYQQRILKTPYVGLEVPTSSDYQNNYFMTCNAVLPGGSSPTLGRTLLQIKLGLFLASYMLDLFFDHEATESTFLRNVGELLLDYRALHPSIQHFWILEMDHSFRNMQRRNTGTLITRFMNGRNHLPDYLASHRILMENLLSFCTY